MVKFPLTVFAFLVMASAAHASDYRYNYGLMNGQAPATLENAESQYGPWTNQNNPYDCSNWSPSTSTIGKGIAFKQTASDCKQDQTRWAQDYKTNNVTNETTKSGAEYQESRTTVGSDERDATGVLENWLIFAPTYTSWVDTNALYGCTAWSPNPSVYTETANFTQTSATCKTDQERQRQDREKERFTDEIRNSGQPVTENQTLNAQTASRPYSVVLGVWTATGEPFDCSNWSPAVDTIGKGVAFTQNATDCKLAQSRTRAESYRDHSTGATVPVAKAPEARTLTSQASSKPAVGTLEAWMATTPTYTAWINTSALNSCSNWSPAGSSKTTSSTFTQTASNCTTDQSRMRQDREAEQNTGEIRDKGVAVEETQTLSAQSASRSYTVTLGNWANSGAKYACSNWSPAPSTVTTGTSFTQTATDCKQDQTRSRAESYVDHKTSQTVAVSVPAESQTLTAQTSTQNATGTKETWMASTPTYSAWVDTSALNACSNWTPAGSTKTSSGSFTQTATNCTTDQTRNRQDREQETTTLAYRDKGAPVAETQTITGQSANRIYTVTLGSWSNNGAVTGCSNWSPDPSTVNSGTIFTQTATDCSQAQIRSRAESYVDHKTGSTVAVSTTNESQTISGQTNTQSATGTKVTVITPTITSFNVVLGSFSPGACAYQGSANWSGTNVANYTLVHQKGTSSLGTATSYSLGSYSVPKGSSKVWTITGCSSTGQCASASATLTAPNTGKCN